MLWRVFFSSFFVFIPFLELQAEESGRLPDGRAYRVGQDGMRLVDQIAELQVSNRELRQHVADLETDLDAKDIMLKNCPNAGSTNSAQSGEAPDCDSLVSNLYLRVNRLQEQLEQGTDSLPPAAGAACNYNSPDNPVWKQVSQLETQLAERDELLAMLQDGQKEALAKIEAKRGAECDFQSSDNPYLAQVKELEEQIAQQDQRIAALQGENSKSRARMRKPHPSGLIVSTTNASEAEIDAAKAEFGGTLANIQKLIFKRKSLYDSSRRGGRGVSVNVQPLETRQRVSLDSLRRQVSRLNNSSDINRVRTGLREISEILENDIQVLQRLSKR